MKNRTISGLFVAFGAFVAVSSMALVVGELPDTTPIETVPGEIAGNVSLLTFGKASDIASGYSDAAALRMWHYGSIDIVPTRGDAFGFDASTGTITNYLFDIGGSDIVIPWNINGIEVSKIGDYAFSDSISGVGDEITSCISARSITNVGNYAFYSCTNLIRVVFPNVINIGNIAFAYCENLESLVIPNIESIGYYMFGGESSTVLPLITRVEFSGNEPTIGDYAFNNTPNLTNYVTSATATGWGETFGVRPVVRAPLHADEVYIKNIAVGTYPDIATNLLYTIVVSNGHWLIKETQQ